MCCVLQVDYVRVDQQRRGLLQMQQHATALAVALPGREGRSLHARGQDAPRLQKLAEKLGALMTKLDIRAPLQPGSAEYKQGLAALRDEQLKSLQADVEKNVSALAVLTYERQQQGAASSITRSQRKQAQGRRKRVRQLVAMLHTWQVVDAPGSDAVQLLPAVWTEAEVTKLFKGEYPWRGAAANRSGAVAAVLAERFRDVCAEVRAGGMQMADGPWCNAIAGCTAAVKHVLEEAAVHGAVAVLLQRSAAKHQDWYEAAVTRFEGLSV
jgi:hypothetical protein